MRKQISDGIWIILLAALLSACSGNTKDEGVIPTLAQLPTGIQTAPSLSSTTITPTANKSNTLSATLITDATSTDMFANLSTATPPIPLDNQPLLFPTLVVGTEITLQGHLTINKDNQIMLSDDAGHTVKVIVADFVAQLVNNQLVQIIGIIDVESDISVIRATGVKALEENGESRTVQTGLPPNGSETPLPLPPGSS